MTKSYLLLSDSIAMSTPITVEYADGTFRSYETSFLVNKQSADDVYYSIEEILTAVSGLGVSPMNIEKARIALVKVDRDRQEAVVEWKKASVDPLKQVEVVNGLKKEIEAVCHRLYSIEPFIATHSKDIIAAKHQVEIMRKRTKKVQSCSQLIQEDILDVDAIAFKLSSMKENVKMELDDIRDNLDAINKIDGAISDGNVIGRITLHEEKEQCLSLISTIESDHNRFLAEIQHAYKVAEIKTAQMREDLYLRESNMKTIRKLISKDAPMCEYDHLDARLSVCRKRMDDIKEDIMSKALELERRITNLPSPKQIERLQLEVARVQSDINHHTKRLKDLKDKVHLASYSLTAAPSPKKIQEVQAEIDEIETKELLLVAKLEQSRSKISKVHEEAVIMDDLLDKINQNSNSSRKILGDNELEQLLDELDEDDQDSDDEVLDDSSSDGGRSDDEILNADSDD